MAPTAAAKALRGIERLSKASGKRISRFPLISWEEMIAVGMTTAAVNPGRVIGRTSGIEKTIREVPNEVGPSAFCDLDFHSARSSATDSRRQPQFDRDIPLRAFAINIGRPCI